MHVQDLGQLDSRVLLFGGPYSNLQATRAVQAEARNRGVKPGHAICTGDIVAYCGDPADTVAEIRRWGCVVVAGNCEKQLAQHRMDCGCGFEDGSACDLLSAGWYAHADAAIGESDRNWMAGLPDIVIFSHRGQRCAVIHGGLSDISRFIWECSDEAVFREELDHIVSVAGHCDLVFAGHSGIPFQRRIGEVEWINAGVIGMPPNDGATETRFAVLSDGLVAVHRLGYDVQGASKRMCLQGLTQGYDAALTSGYWPSEDVLPAGLRRDVPASG